MADLENPFAPPKADLVDAWGPAPETTAERSLDDAMAGNWSLEPGKILERSWELVRGSKLAFVLAFFVLAIPTGIGSLVQTLIVGLDAGFVRSYAVGTGVGFLLMPITAPLYAGIWRLQVRRAAGMEIHFTEVFTHFNKIVPLVIGQLVVSLATTLGFVLLVLPGLYLSLAGSMTLPLIAERGLSPVDAFTTSIKAVSTHFFDVVVVYLLVMVLFVAGMLALGIGLLWAGPAASIVMGSVYLTIFGWRDPNAG